MSEGLEHTWSTEWLSRAFRDQEAIASELADPDRLAAIAKAFVEIASANGAAWVVGASRDGERLAGAVALRSGGAVRLLNGAIDGQAILIVDPLLVTGAQIGDTVNDLRRRGATRLIAATIEANVASAESLEAVLDAPVATVRPARSASVGEGESR
jgi:adenine/guanine phosphoribosyltransferase-like PRPP-binding protein